MVPVIKMFKGKQVKGSYQLYTIFWPEQSFLDIKKNLPPVLKLKIF